MKYDPIKKFLGGYFNRSIFLRKSFYILLDLLLLRAWHIRKELAIWKRNNPGETNILDAGSGFGQYAYRMARMNSKYLVTGIDVKEEQISECNAFAEKAKLSDRLKFQIADLTEFNKVDTFNLVLSVDVMEHIEQDSQVFSNFYDSLKRDGMLLISTPSDKGGSGVHDDEDESFIGEHVRNGYGSEEIREKLTQAGFSDISVRYSYGWPGKISWKLSMKYPVMLLNFSRVFILVLPFYYLIVYPLCFLLNFIDVRKTHSTGTGLIVKAFKKQKT